MPKPKSLAGRIALVTGGAGGIGTAIAARYLAEGACVVLADIDAAALDGTVGDARHAPTATTMSAASLMDVTDEDGRRERLRRGGRRVRRHRHPRLQCRHLLVGADRGDHARHVEPQHGHPGDRLFPRLARGLPADEAAEARRRRSSSSPPRTASPPRPTPPPTAPPRPPRSTSPAASRSKARRRRHPRQRRQSRRRAARLEDLAGEWREQRAAAYKMKPDELEEHYRQRSLLKRQRLPRGHRRGASTSSPPTSRRNRPATSSTSTPATCRASRGNVALSFRPEPRPQPLAGGRRRSQLSLNRRRLKTFGGSRVYSSPARSCINGRLIAAASAA